MLKMQSILIQIYYGIVIVAASGLALQLHNGSGTLGCALFLCWRMVIEYVKSSDSEKTVFLYLKKRIIAVLIFVMRFVSLMVLVSMSMLIYADAPTRTPSDYIVCSMKGTYCAYVSTVTGIKVFEPKASSKKIYPLIAIRGWYPQTFLSDDGKKLVTVGSSIVPDYSFDQAIVKVWINGNFTRSFLVRDLVEEHKMTKSSSGFHWGEPVGFEQDGSYFSFMLDDGTKKNTYTMNGNTPTMVPSVASLVANTIAPGDQSVALTFDALDIMTDMSVGKLPIARIPVSKAFGAGGQLAADTKWANYEDYANFTTPLWDQKAYTPAISNAFTSLTTGVAAYNDFGAISSVTGFGSSAAGGYVIYPNSPNTNMMSSVYRK